MMLLADEDNNDNDEAADRLRRRAHIREAMMLHADEDDDDEDDIDDLFNVQLDQLGVDDVADGNAAPAPDQEIPPVDQPINDMDRYIMANVGPLVGHPPRMNNPFLDPLELPLDRGDVDDMPEIPRAMRRRRRLHLLLRNHGGRDEEEIRLMRAMLV
jgi:hypothetical protein